METRGTSPVSVADRRQEFKMIDIGLKKDTHRRAVASGVFSARAETISRIRERSLPKGDVLSLAEVAGIHGAKGTSALLPLCHPISLSSVRVWMEIAQQSIQVFCEARSIGKTGVEMEALSGVTAALLCIYDLTKGIDPVLRFGEVQLEVKEGGKSGIWKNPESETPERFISTNSDEIPSLNAPVAANDLRGLSVNVITLSDRCSMKERDDRSGPAIRSWFESRGASITHSALLGDDSEKLKKELLGILEKNAPQLIVTTGGTGLSIRDITPETILQVCRERGGKEIPGIGELLRMKGSAFTPRSWLSRSLATLVGETIILCLPGSPSAVVEGLDIVGDLLKHALHVGRGGDHS